MQTLETFGNNFIPVIPIKKEPDQAHTASSPFCLDPHCPCHEDEEAISVVAGQVANGLLTAKEATRTVEGKML